jgi:hypothetical protein
MNVLKDHYLRQALTPKVYNQLSKEASAFTSEKAQIGYILDNAGLDSGKQKNIRKILKAIDFNDTVRSKVADSLNQKNTVKLKKEIKEAKENTLIAKAGKVHAGVVAKVKDINDNRVDKIHQRNPERAIKIKTRQAERTLKSEFKDPHQKYKISEQNKTAFAKEKTGIIKRIGRLNALANATGLFDLRKLNEHRIERLENMSKVKDPSQVDSSSTWGSLNAFMKALYVLNIPTQTLSWAVDKINDPAKAHKWDGHSWTYAVANLQSKDINKPIDLADNVIGLAMDMVLDPIAMIGWMGKFGKVKKVKGVVDTLYKWKAISKLDDIKNASTVISKLDNIIIGIGKTSQKYATKADKAKQLKIIQGVRKYIVKNKDKTDEFIKLAKRGEKHIGLEKLVEKASKKIGEKIKKKMPGVYRTFGSDDTALKATKKTRTVAKQVKGLAKTDKTGSSLKYIDDINKGDTVNTVLDAGANLQDVVDFEAAHLKKIMETRSKKIAKQIKGAKWKDVYSEMNKSVINAIETDTIDKLPKAEQRLAKYFKGQMDKVSKYEDIAKGKPNKIKNYVPHIDAKTGRAVNPDEEARLIKEMVPFAGEKRSTELTIKALNEGSKDGSIATTKLVDDLPTLLKKRKAETIRSYMNYNIQKKMSHLITDAPKKNYVEIIHPFLTANKKKYIPKVLYDKVKPLLELSDKEISTAAKFHRSIKDATDVWKVWTLALAPKYHFNNLVGNTFQNFVAGVKSKWYIKALQMQSKGKRIAVVDKLGVIHSIDIKELKRLGILGGRYGKDIELLKHLDDAKLAKKLVANKAIKAGFDFGSYVEDNQRITHFLSKLEETGSIDDAVKSVEKYLYNYSPNSFTAFENKVMKILIPFYAFTKRNLSATAKILLGRPTGMHSFKTLYQLNLHNDMRQDKVSDKMMDRRLRDTFKMKVGVNKKTGKEYYMPIAGMLPFLQLGDLFNSVGHFGGVRDFIVGQSNPVLKEIASQIFNYDFDRGEVIDYQQKIGLNDPLLVKAGKVISGKADKIKNVPERRSFLGVDMPKKMYHALKNIRVLAILNKANPADLFGTRESLSMFGKLSSARKKDFAKKLLDMIVTTDFEYSLDKGYKSRKREIIKQISAIKRNIRNKQTRKKSIQSKTIKSRIQKEISDLLAVSRQLKEEMSELEKAYKEAKRK